VRNFLKNIFLGATEEDPENKGPATGALDFFVLLKFVDLCFS
jgi:hypothetical protein